MHWLISLLLLYKKTPEYRTLWFPDSGHFGLNTVIQYSDNRFLNNGQWAGHNDQWAGHSMHACPFVIDDTVQLGSIALSDSKCHGWIKLLCRGVCCWRRYYPCVCWLLLWRLGWELVAHGLNVDNSDSDTEEVDYDLLLSPPKLTCFKQAIEALEDVQAFLEHRGYVEQATSVGKVMINPAGISVHHYTQTTIDQYFS